VIGRRGLVLALLVASACSPSSPRLINAPEAAWVINNSSSQIVVAVIEVGKNVIVDPNSSGNVYSRAGGTLTGPVVRVLTAGCEVLATGVNARHNLVVTVDADNTVRFEQGANFDGEAVRGSIQTTTQCQT
jgi:hypothetical protein